MPESNERISQEPILRVLYGGKDRVTLGLVKIPTRGERRERELLELFKAALARLSAVPCAQSVAGIYSSDGSFDHFACLEDGDNTQVFNGARRWHKKGK
jgi:hypothetical protein